MTWQQVANHLIDVMFSFPVFLLLSLRMIVVMFAGVVLKSVDKK